MKLSKTHIIVLAVLAVLFLGAWALPLFPDPYHRDGNVTFVEWIKREIDELSKGEVSTE